MSDRLEPLLELLARGRAVSLRARGASMRPFVRDGDVVLLSPPGDPLRLAAGELLLALRGGALRLHRAVRVDRSAGRVELRGDALRESDGWFQARELVARVRALTRGGRAVPGVLWRGPLPLLAAPALRAGRAALAFAAASGPPLTRPAGRIEDPRRPAAPPPRAERPPPWPPDR